MGNFSWRGESWRWSMIHAHRELVDEGRANPILCPDCGAELVVKPNDDAEPVLKCQPCAVTYTPGKAVWDQMEKVLLTSLEKIED